MPLGSYSPEKSQKIVYKNTPKYSMSFRHEGAKADSIPGPNAYMIPQMLGPYTVATTASPSYTMTGKSKLGHFYDDLHKTPGPAAYVTPETELYKKKSPVYSMGSRIKSSTIKLGPGPADYEVGKTSLLKSCAPVVSFGIRHSDYTSPLIVDVC
uniref:Uncharacterized protein n=1 Tax=Sphaerodactylus townsendi TaxID=933632 RepID=A0ACB8G3N9_9SAUR